MPIGIRRLPASRSRTVSPVVGGRRRLGACVSGPAAIGGSSASSRSKSRNCSDSCTPPSPSAIVWCSFWIRAAAAALQAVDDEELPQRAGAVERVGDDQGGQVEQLAHRRRAWAGRCGARGSRCRTRGRRPTTAAVRLTGVGCTRWRSRGTRRRGPLHAAQEAVDVGPAVEDRDVGERRREVRVLLQPPHQALGVAHARVELRGPCHAAGTLRHPGGGPRSAGDGRVLELVQRRSTGGRRGPARWTSGRGRRHRGADSSAGRTRRGRPR